ncbi:hypothetical protein CEE37_03235 [candidate division LCP-89 bacterium B3_LCP]|uniref:Glycosyltransferase RgtA/B/C/D-like domain-containing protein n=1 Tax=candidate division LCP-89 bacterium B3_LCP TaxID=2012998 RepID=A0A532V387_UNCL8|nr:MAG: hypothetical protein CEE37_03235 [candidate division LCP-89 bacterium B3_LCP]
MADSLLGKIYRSFCASESARIKTILIIAFTLRFLAILPFGNDISVPYRDQNTYYSLARAIVDDGYLGIPTIPRGPYVEHRQDHTRSEGFYPAFHDSLCAVWDGQGYLYGMVEWGKPNSFFEPLYPLLCAAFYVVFGDNFFFWRLVHVIFGTLMVFFLYDIARRSFKDWRIATLAALYVTFYPHFIFYSWILMSEALLLLLLSAGVWAYVRLLEKPEWHWAVLTGVFFGVFTLTRSFLIAFFPFMVIFILLFVRSPKRWFLAGLAAFSFILTMSPWLIRNYVLQDQFVLLSSRGGYNIWMRNNPYFIEDELQAMGVEFSPEKLDKLNYREYILGYPDFTPEQGELERNEILTREGIKFIKSNLGFFLEMSWIRFKWTIGYRGIGLRGPLLNGISLLSYGPALLGFLISIIIGWRFLRYTLPLWSLVGYFILFYSLTHEGLRYRVPVDPYIILLAVFSAVYLYCRFKKKPFPVPETAHAG